MDEDISITDWISQIREKHPDLPKRLTLEVERSRLERLRSWRTRVAKLREAYDDLPEKIIPDALQELSGGRVVVPAMMSIDTMTDDEVEAWHELFACVVPQMTDLAQKYWQAHDGEKSSLVMADVLQHLPIVFLYVLSNYDETRQGDNDGEFAEEEGRTRLTTWITIEARRHIKGYLQSSAYLIGPGSSYLHRLRSQMRKIQNDHYAQHGEYPDHEKLIDDVKHQSYYGRSVSREALSSRLRELQTGTSIVSTDAPVDGEGENDVQYKDVMGSEPDVADDEMSKQADAHEYVRERTESEATRREACMKVLTSTETLTVEERYHF